MARPDAELIMSAIESESANLARMAGSRKFAGGGYKAHRADLRAESHRLHQIARAMRQRAAVQSGQLGVGALLAELEV